MQQSDRLLHVMHDDKFNDRAVVRFEEVHENQNDYYAVGAPSAVFRFIQSNKVKPIGAEALEEKVRHSGYRAIIFHSLPKAHLGILRAVPPQTPVVWIGWGYDYYRTLLAPVYPYPHGLLEPRTIACFESQRPKQSYLSRAKRYLKGVLGKEQGKAFRKEDYQKVSVFVPVLKSEWRLARENNRWFKADYRPWIYSRENDIKAYSTPIRPDAANILVGNSASVTNNHIDAFQAIADSIIASDYECIVCPLSYGSSRVKEEARKQGEYYFGDRFCPLFEFLAKPDYIELVRGCHTVVMNHVRQQALGNINAAFSIGSRVLINGKSPLVEEFNDRGLIFGLTNQPDTWDVSQDALEENIVRQASWWKSREDPRILSRFIDAL